MRYSLTIFLFLVFFSFLTGCNNKYIDEIDRGAGYNYRPGFPELRLSAAGYVEENNSTKIIISGDIVYGSLVYKKIQNSYQADIAINIQITNDSQNEPVISREFRPVIKKENPNIINSQDVYRFDQEFEVPSGDYTIEVLVTDLTSAKQTIRKSNTSIPNPEDTISHITEIRVLGKKNEEENSDFNPVTTYDAPGKLDSLMFTFQVTNNKPGQPLTLESRLLKFKSDTSIARPMNFNNYSPSSLPYKGIEFDDSKVIQNSRRVLNQPGSVLIEFIFTDLEKGNYRLEVTSQDQEEELYKARDFSIKSENYPALKTPSELAEPLYYLMEEKEYKKLLSLKSPDSVKAAIDRFWLSNIKNSNLARDVISLYYQRVEEANKQFSNFKEGWKTDPGMIFILFGPPWYTDSFSDEMTWLYTYNTNDSEKVFNFKQPKLKSKYFPYENYILHRTNFYYNVHLRQVNKWLSGQIMRDNL